MLGFVISSRFLAHLFELWPGLVVAQRVLPEEAHLAQRLVLRRELLRRRYRVQLVSEGEIAKIFGVFEPQSNPKLLIFI